MFIKRHEVSDNLSAGEMFAFHVTKEGDSEYLQRLGNNEKTSNPI